MSAATLVRDTAPLAATLKANGRTLPKLEPFCSARAAELQAEMERTAARYAGAKDLYKVAGPHLDPAAGRLLDTLLAVSSAACHAFCDYYAAYTRLPTDPAAA